MTNEQTKSLLMRFLRGGIAGATSVMVTLLGASANTNGIKSLADLELWLVGLLMAGIVGFISGFIMAIDKWARMN